jgi:hypothetical protein
LATPNLWFTNSFGYRPELPVSPYAPARARLLQEAGYPNGFSTTIYYGPFVNSPGIKEWLEAAASFWKEIGIEVKIFEIASSEFYSRFGVGQVQPERKWRPLAVQTWGRQEHMLHIANIGYQPLGRISAVSTNAAAWWRRITSTMDDGDVTGHGSRDYVAAALGHSNEGVDGLVIPTALAHPTAARCVVRATLADCGTEGSESHTSNLQGVGQHFGTLCRQKTPSGPITLADHSGGVCCCASPATRSFLATRA